MINLYLFVSALIKILFKLLILIIKFLSLYILYVVFIIIKLMNICINVRVLV